jgi:hypothetical protein
MQFKLWLENWEVEWKGAHFKSGQPVTFKYLKNKEKAPNFGPLYQQDIEPHGKYVIQKEIDDAPDDERWESGEITFQNPLVLPFNSEFSRAYDSNSWKAELSRRFGGKTGRALSQAIVAAGYDGIVTVDVGPDGKPYDTREIVDLRSFKHR